MALLSFCPPCTEKSPPELRPLQALIETGLAAQGNTELRGFNFHFLADFLDIRRQLDPLDDIKPTQYTEKFLDDDQYSLITRGDFYKQVQGRDCERSWYDEEEGEAPSSYKIDANYARDVHQERDGDANVASQIRPLIFTEFDSAPTIDEHLQTHYGSNVSQSQLGRVLVEFEVLRWKYTLKEDDEDFITAVVQLDSILLPSGKFYDVGTVRVRYPHLLDMASVRRHVLELRTLRSIQASCQTAPTKFCVAVSDLTRVPSALSQYDTASTHIKPFSPQWMVWSSHNANDFAADSPRPTVVRRF